MNLIKKIASKVVISPLPNFQLLVAERTLLTGNISGILYQALKEEFE